MIASVAPSAAAPTRKRKPKVYPPFTLPHFRRWAADLILDTGASWHPEDFQEWFVEDLFSGLAVGHGIPTYSEAWELVPEGNTKTTTLAGVALYHSEHRPFAAVPVAAASREQAEILYRQAEGFVLRSEALYAPVHSVIQAAKGKRKTTVPRFVCLEGYRRINHHGGGRIQVFAADDRTGDGIIPTLGIIDEPHRLRDLSLYRTWAGKIAKRGGQIAAISTSGEPDSDFELTLQRIREGATEVKREGSFSRYATNRLVFHEWAVPPGADIEDMAVVKAANPFSGITEEMLAEKFNSPTMTHHHWMRFVCNRPTRDLDVWLGPEGDRIWADLERKIKPVPGAETWAGVDVGIKRDSTAVVMVQALPDGHLAAWVKLWVPTKVEAVDVTDVMAYLRTLDKTYRLGGISFDPRFFDVPAKMLGDSGLPMVEVPQSVERMTPIIADLYDRIMRGEVHHDGDPAFAAQVLNAVARSNERGFTLAKGKSRGRIDACIALALAVDRAQNRAKPRPALFVGAA